MAGCNIWASTTTMAIAMVDIRVHFVGHLPLCRHHKLSQSLPSTTKVADNETRPTERAKSKRVTANNFPHVCTAPWTHLSLTFFFVGPGTEHCYIGWSDVVQWRLPLRTTSKLLARNISLSTQKHQTYKKKTKPLFNHHLWHLFKEIVQEGDAH